MRTPVSNPSSSSISGSLCAILVLRISDIEPFPSYFFGWLFIVSAIGLAVINVRLNGASIALDYQQGMLKKHGKEMSARVIGKAIGDSKDKHRIGARVSHSIKTELIASFR